MTDGSIGVAVIGAGMAGRAHAAAYRAAGSIHRPDLPEVRLVAVADLDPDLAKDAARRYGFQRSTADWASVVADPSVDAVSVVVANDLHRPVVEALLSAGKHVLCEKPLAPTLEDGEAMASAATSAPRQVAAVGFTYRRSPALAAIEREVRQGRLGAIRHFAGHYHSEYAADPMVPAGWRYRGGPGSGALADLGSHLLDLAELVCGRVTTVQGAMLPTYVSHRPLPVGPVVGHARSSVRGDLEPVENEDVAVFTAAFATGAVGTFSVSRIAYGLPNSLGFAVFGTTGAARFDMARPGEFEIADEGTDARTAGFRTVTVGPAHPYVERGLPLDYTGTNLGHSDLFTFQARAFLEQVAGIDGSPPCASFEDGLHNLRLVHAVAASAASGGSQVVVDDRAVGRPGDRVSGEGGAG